MVPPQLLSLIVSSFFTPTVFAKYSTQKSYMTNLSFCANPCQRKQHPDQCAVRPAVSSNNKDSVALHCPKLNLRAAFYGHRSRKTISSKFLYYWAGLQQLSGVLLLVRLKLKDHVFQLYPDSWKSLKQISLFMLQVSRFRHQVRMCATLTFLKNIRLRFKKICRFTDRRTGHKKIDSTSLIFVSRDFRLRRIECEG